jgi:dihydroorotate dehydrogenase
MTHPFTVGGIPMQLPIMMGGGVCKFVHQLDPYLRPDLPVGALELGSITPACREGNLESPQWPETSEEFQQYGFGLNAWSMPNAGFEDSLTRLAGILSPHPLVVNVAGEKPAHFVLGVARTESLQNVVASTLNFGCPNMEKIPIAYSIPSMRVILEDITRYEPNKPVWVKLSPYITKAKRDRFQFLLRCQTGLDVDMSEVPTAPAGFLEEVLDLLCKYHFVKGIILTNTLGNVKLTDPKTGEPAIGSNGGKAGLSGDFLRENIVLPLVKRAIAFLGNYIDIIACGGGLKGEHILDFLNTGAKGVQCVSGPTWNGGPRFFQNLIEESPALQDYLADYLQ